MKTALIKPTNNMVDYMLKKKEYQTAACCLLSVLLYIKRELVNRDSQVVDETRSIKWNISAVGVQAELCESTIVKMGVLFQDIRNMSEYYTDIEIVQFAIDYLTYKLGA